MRKIEGDRGRMRREWKSKELYYVLGVPSSGVGLWNNRGEVGLVRIHRVRGYISVAGFKVTLEKPVNGYSFSDIPAAAAVLLYHRLSRFFKNTISR